MLQLDRFEVLTLDCYGTLIDWETGIWEALEPILRQHGCTLSQEQALEDYAEFETEAEAGTYQAYKMILAHVLDMFGDRFGFEPSGLEREAFSTSVRNWPAFPDSARALRALRQKYQLAIISNIDDDLFAHSQQKLDTRFDWVITAQQAGSYKPALNNFRLALSRIGHPQDRILHVAQSLFHDILPAKQLGLAAVWVNRRHGKAGFGATPAASAQPDLEVPDLESLAKRVELL